MKKNYGVLMMGGSGTRFGADRPKQFVEIKGKPVFLYIVEDLIKNSLINGIVIVCHTSWIDYVKEKVKWMDKIIDVVPGGDCRSKSVYNGLIKLKEIANDDDVVLIHDATHPYFDKEKIGLLIEKTEINKAATMVTSVYDTCYIKDDNGFISKTIDRKTIAVGASPECFTFGLIYSIYSESTAEELETMTSAGAMLLNKGIRMAIVESDLLNLKITYHNDMELFKLLCDTYFYKD